MKLGVRLDCFFQFFKFSIRKDPIRVMPLDKFAKLMRFNYKHCRIVYAEYSFLVGEDDDTIHVNVHSKFVSDEVPKEDYASLGLFARASNLAQVWCTPLANLALYHKSPLHEMNPLLFFACAANSIALLKNSISLSGINSEMIFDDICRLR